MKKDLYDFFHVYMFVCHLIHVLTSLAHVHVFVCYVLLSVASHEQIVSNVCFCVISGLKEEGIYRLSPSLRDINRLKAALNAGTVQCVCTHKRMYMCMYLVHVHAFIMEKLISYSILCFSPMTLFLFFFIFKMKDVHSVDVFDSCWSDIHVFAGALKLYLRELPEPVFTYQLYQDFIHAGSEFVICVVCTSSCMLSVSFSNDVHVHVNTCNVPTFLMLQFVQMQN